MTKITPLVSSSFSLKRVVGFLVGILPLLPFGTAADDSQQLWSPLDIGKAPIAGVSHVSKDGAITVTASGRDIWESSDQFHFVFLPLSGDGEITARLSPFAAGTDGWAKAGLMIREHPEAISKNVAILNTGSNGVVSQARRMSSGASEHLNGGTSTYPLWVRIVRKGNLFSTYRSFNGSQWLFLASYKVPMNVHVFAGVAVSSRNPDVVVKTTMKDVKVSHYPEPAPVGIPEPWSAVDVANPVIPGSTQFDSQDSVRMASRSAGIANSADQFHFLSVPMSGDGEFVTQLTQNQIPEGTLSQAGIMMRESREPGSKHASLLVLGEAGTGFNYRTRNNRPVESSEFSPSSGDLIPVWLKLVRTGEEFSAFRSKDGITWKWMGSVTIPMQRTIFVGLAVTSQTLKKNVVARFSNIRRPSTRDELTFEAGLAAWRTPDKDGIRCVDCHSPMGYDLAMFNFTREDLRRAGKPHLPRAENDKIFEMLELLRGQYAPEGGLKDFLTFRPMQPTGKVIGGATSTARVRDAAFGQYLGQNFRIAGNRISTLAEARLAAKQLVEVDLFTVPIGVKFPLFSRSVSREGEATGGEINEWLPGIGLQPKPELSRLWFYLHDIYIQNPTEENMWAIFHKIEEWLVPDEHNFVESEKSASWLKQSKDLYRSTLVFQHDQLQRARGEVALFDRENGLNAFSAQANRSVHTMAFMWDVGDISRDLNKVPMHELPVRHQESVFAPGSLDLRPQIINFQLPWLYIGWLMDNSLVSSGPSNSTLVGEYLLGSMWEGDLDDGAEQIAYRNHYVFFNAVHQYLRAFRPGAWSTLPAETRPQHFTIKKGYYLAFGRWRDERIVPGYPNADVLYKRFISNHLRMNLLIGIDEIKKAGIVYLEGNPADRLYFQNDLLQIAESYIEILAWADPRWKAADRKLVDSFKSTVLAHPHN